MNLKNLKQFKMLGGEELLAEILSWPDEDDEDNTLLVRYALVVISGEDFSKGVRYYTFKPFMMYQDQPNQNIHINLDHITSIAIPHEALAGQWVNHIRMVNKKDDDELFEEIFEMDSDTDPDGPNILQFKPRLH